MKNKKYKVFILLILLTLTLIVSLRNYCSLNSKKYDVTNNSEEIIKKLSAINNTFNKSDIIFFIDFEDFSCPQCQNQVIYLIKLIDQNLDYIDNEKVLLLVRKRNNNEQYYNWIISNWINENKIKQEIQLDNYGIIDSLKISKSSIAILKESKNNLSIFKEFPMDRKDLEKIVNVIKFISYSKQN